MSRAPRIYADDLEQERSEEVRSFLTHSSYVAFGPQLMKTPTFNEALAEQYEGLDATLHHDEWGLLRTQFKVRFTPYKDWLFELGHVVPGSDQMQIGWGLELVFDTVDLDYLCYGWLPLRTCVWFPYPALEAVVKSRFERWFRHACHKSSGFYFPPPASTDKWGRKYYETHNMVVPLGGIFNSQRGLIDLVNAWCRSHPELDPLGRGVIPTYLPQ